MTSRRVRFSEVKPDYFPLGGGLDLLTPAIAMPPGRLISSQNYEPQIAGGYRRIDGHERYDGRAAPSSKSYWIAPVVLTGVLTNGDTVTGASSAATGVVLYQIAGFLVLGAVTGTFMNGEVLNHSGAVGTVGLVTAGSAPDASDHADYTNLAADLQRAAITVVPGSGRIRGVWYYKNTLYAFRDNAGGTAGDMYKATAGGWVKVNFGTEIQFSSATGGTTPIVPGQTIGNLAVATKTATVVAVLTRSGTWGTDAVGTLIITPLIGSFSNADQIWVGATQKGVATSAATSITRLPGGALDFFNANFTGSTATKKMYGADGVNLGFEFDGTNYIPIRTGMVTDTPTHVIEHRNYLYFSFLGSSQNSGIGNPYAWTVILGAAEIATGDPITGYLVQSGGTSTAALAIFTEGMSFILYGSGPANWNLVPSTDDIGAFAFCSQSIGNDTMLLSNRGIQKLKTTLNYGNYEYASVSHLIQPMITARRGQQTASTSLKTKNQYRVYFTNPLDLTDNLCLAVGLTGDKINGVLPLDYGRPVRCICTAEDSTGAEVTWFGSDDGYVYQDHVGTSLDGANITAWARLAYNHLKSPRFEKRFRGCVLELVVDGYTELDTTYSLGYGTLDVADGVAVLGQQLLASGGFWDQFTWDKFTWDAQAVGNPYISLDGTEENISMLFYSSRDQDNSHTLQGYTLLATPTKLKRG